MKKTVIIFALQILVFANAFAQIPKMFKYQAVLRDVGGNIIANQNKTIIIDILQSNLSASVFNESHNVTTNAQGLINLNIGSINDLSGINWFEDTYFIQISMDGNVLGTSQLLSVPYALSSETSENLNGTITESQISDFGTYLETESDPAFLTWDKSSGISITESQISDFGTYLETESDPAFSTNFDVSNVNTGDLLIFDGTKFVKYTPNYLTSETDGSIDNEIQNLSQVLSEGNSAENLTISNLAEPVNSQDAATKAYVDALLARIGTLEETAILYEGFTDVRDGNHYNVTKIGNQIWMADNLRYLPSVSIYSTSSFTDPYYYVYGHTNTDVNLAKSSFNYTYVGVLYNWAAAMNGATSSNLNPSGVQGVCPAGWHLPSSTEWAQLAVYLKQDYAGARLKQIGTTHWNSPNVGALDNVGFTGLPGGARNSSGFTNIANYGYWWTSTENTTTNAKIRSLSSGDTYVSSLDFNKDFGFSVRCVKD